MPSSAKNDNPPPPNSITALYQALVGPLGQTYYLARFTRFDDIGRSFPTWNWAAGLLTLNWLLFRGLWASALGYAGAVAGAALAVFGLGKLVLGFTDDTVHALLGVALAVAFVVPGMYGDAWYHRRCKRQMAQAILGTDDNAQAARKLAGLAPSPKRLSLLALGNALVLAPIVALLTLSWQLPGAGKLAGPSVAASSSPAMPASLAARPASAAPSSVSPTSSPAAIAAASAPASQPVSQQVSAAGPSAAAARRSDGGSIALAPEPAASAVTPSRPASAIAAPAAAPQVGATAVASTPTPAPKATPVPPAAAHASSPASSPAIPPAKAASATAAPTSPAAATTSMAKAPPVPVPAAAKATPKPAAPPKTRQFYVDAGIYAQTGNAKRAVDSLRQAQLPVLADELDMARGTRTRVRVGPYPSRAQAEQVVRQVKELGLPALVEPAR